MAEKLPEGQEQLRTTHSLLTGMPVPSDISVAAQNLGSPRGCGEPYLNRSSSVRNKTHLEVGGTRLPDSDAKLKFEWVEQYEPGVYVTLAALPGGGARDIKRVRFSRRRFSERQAEQWWQENRARVYQLYNVHDKSVASTDSDVEKLTRKSHLLEVELERTTEQFKEAISVEGEETAKCKAEKEVIKSLTAQLKGMADKLPDSDAKVESEWVEQDEPGVYVTLTALPGGARDLKRIRFSGKRFSEIQAKQWWEENRARVYELYKVRVVDTSVASIESTSLTLPLLLVPLNSPEYDLRPEGVLFRDIRIGLTSSRSM